MEPLRTNFAPLKQHDEQLLRLGMLAERYFPDDPNTSLLKTRQLCELLAQLTATKVGIFTSPEEPQYELLNRLQDHGILPREVAQLFGEVRRQGNAANHSLAGDHRIALNILKISWQLGLWFHRTFRDASFKSGPFVPPTAPKDESPELRTELNRLRGELQSYQTTHKEAAQRLDAAEAELRATKSEQVFWEQMASEAEQAKSAIEARLAAWQSTALAQSTAATTTFVAAANKAAESVQLDEKATRQIIDDQLREAGWVVDSATIRYGQGHRPRAGTNLAIAEWPTATGPADYVLFVGLTPMATVEAKRENIDVSASLQQAKRYSRGFESADGIKPSGPWGEYRTPFTFSSNGRPYLRQIETKSGVWFCDVRRSENLATPLDGWYTPEGLSALLKIDVVQSHKNLEAEPFLYGFHVRPYQQTAIKTVEKGIADGRQVMLLAMATGTGKTKTCVALIYRLLKAKRFRRILFLVDRSALGEQAANAFKDTRMENLQTFADTFGIKELEDAKPDTDTTVHIATIQGMVQRVLNPGPDRLTTPIDEYDCVIVDECHRGYLLDREMSDVEMGFRDFGHYISQYRRVLDYFHAVKIGLTATPALHTTQIFGMPIFTYSYREAVIDGYLIDHEPPIQIKTELSSGGIVWLKGESVTTFDARKNQLALFTAPDEIKLDIEDFNRKVITRPFNEVVCDYLARELDPNSRQKTLVFCATDAHADMVVELLKAAFKRIYGSVDDDAVIKITGSADKPLQLIRRYKNERHPNVAVTVDLLTTGVDVPEICNLVFLRRVNSRILFDQMLGRATRLCETIQKETFRVFDAVRIYEALQNMTAMQPVVVDPKIDFADLAKELAQVPTDEARALVRDQFLAKLQRKKHTMTEAARRDFETCAGMAPDAFVTKLKAMRLSDVAAWFTQNPALGEILDRQGASRAVPVFVSSHRDKLVEAVRGWGDTKKPEDYLKEFAAYLQANQNTLPALVTVLTRPRDLTRKQLRELALLLDREGFSESNLATAWREMTNQEIAARVVGYIRQAALGDPLMPYGQRVDQALQRTLASRAWTTPQRQWLQKIAAQTKANIVVDRDALDDPDLIFGVEGGGFARLDRIFDGRLGEVLDTFNDALWPGAA